MVIFGNPIKYTNSSIFKTYLYLELRWGYFDFDTSNQVSEKYIKLMQLSFQETNIQERINNLHTRNKYAIYVEVLFNIFVTNLNQLIDEALKMHLMKSCFFDHYTIFVLKKHSPYTAFINDKLKRCVILL